MYNIFISGNSTPCRGQIDPFGPSRSNMNIGPSSVLKSDDRGPKYAVLTAIDTCTYVPVVEWLINFEIYSNI